MICSIPLKKPLVLSSLIKIIQLSLLIFIVISINCTLLSAQEYSRGVGVYPGDPDENFAPDIKIDNHTYRNLALHKAAYQSSSIDYNLTSQLITDGIIQQDMPSWIVTSGPKGVFKKYEKQWMLDRHFMTRIPLDTSDSWIQLDLKGNSSLPEIDSININGNLIVNEMPPAGWKIKVNGSNDGKIWQEISQINGDHLPGDSVTGFWRKFLPHNMRLFNYPLKLNKTIKYCSYRFSFSSPNVLSWNIGETALLKNKKRVIIGGPYQFTSAWMATGHNSEWVYVDLGAVCTFDLVKFFWIKRPLKGIVQISNDAERWKDIGHLHKNVHSFDEIELDNPVKGRYVRLLMEDPASDDGFILSEMEVFGYGGTIAVPKAIPVQKDDNSFNLDGGNWKLQRSSEVTQDGLKISQSGFNDRGWIQATVPATVLTSFVNIDAVPDPNYSDNQLMISDSYFYSDFWYRKEFKTPSFENGKRIYLNFDGINWKAEIYLNGQKLGNIEGAFIRGKFDITDILKKGKKNYLAVLIKKNEHPGFVKEQTQYNPDANGGELGADNPTFHASAGWDWIPTIRGRNTGIWNDVYLTTCGPVTIEHPFVRTQLPLPDTASARVNIDVNLHNHKNEKINGILKGTFGDISFQQKVSLRPLETSTIKFNPENHPALFIKNPELWWPNGYGAQKLYRVKIRFETVDKQISDEKSFDSGIREMSYDDAGGILKMWVNGRRFIGNGGNWGFSESMLRYRGREYNTAVRYHKDMNFTMIRNWVGQTADDEFFDACDRYGIMIWQDFWLANPLDGPNPSDNDLFMANVKDFVLRIRNHPSIALYCGRNEGNAPEALDSAIRKLLPEIHPDIHYISNSAFGVVSGGGPYRAMPLEYYFKERTAKKMHSEMGMPNIVTYESLRLMMPDSSLWPQRRMWGVHDFCLGGAMHASSFKEMMTTAFGKINNARDWVSLAQWINYQGYRAMFEAQGKYRMGLLLWMSHPAWPSMVWQTYDYYFAPTAAYFACKKANEPLHIQWNVLTDSVEVVNYHAGDKEGLIAKAELLNMDGTLQWKKEIKLNAPEDSYIPCFKIEYPDSLSPVFFIRLKLLKDKKILSENFYWKGTQEYNYQALFQIPKVKLATKTTIIKKEDKWLLTTQLSNISPDPALMIRLKVIRKKSGDRILPVIYSDNYINLLPGEKQSIKMELNNMDTRGEKPAVVISGFNVLTNY